MFAVTVTFKIAPGSMATFLPRMRQQARDSLTLEPACTHFDVWTDPERPDEVFLYELYDDAAAFDTHCASAHFESFAADIAPLVTDRTLTTYAIRENSDG
ncbi:MAG: putative quinol monooxygenase [Pseudomonadota bacterium]